jgi:hypothetical protein
MNRLPILRERKKERKKEREIERMRNSGENIWNRDKTWEMKEKIFASFP